MARGGGNDAESLEVRVVRQIEILCVNKGRGLSIDWDGPNEFLADC